MKGWQQRVAHEPPWWSALINPHFIPRRALFSAMHRSAHHLKGRVLDIGCGRQPYRKLLRHSSTVIGLEIDSPTSHANSSADVFYAGEAFPFGENSFDSALCNQVLEHAKDSQLLLSEIHRVLKAGGILVLSVPFTWPEHEQPHDERRLTSFGLSRTLKNAGFSILELDKLVGGNAAIAALLADSIGESMRRLPAALRIPLRAALIAPISWCGAALDFLRRDNNPSFYIDNFVVAQRLAD